MMLLIKTLVLVTSLTWISYLSDDGNFSISFPEEPIVKSEEVQTTLGSLDVLTVYCEGGEEDRNNLYLVNTMEYPEEYALRDSTATKDEMLRGSIEEIRVQLGGRIDYSSEGQKGYKYRISYNKDSAICKGQIFFSGNEYYSLQVFTSSTNSLNDDMERFLKSFRLR